MSHCKVIWVMLVWSSTDIMLLRSVTSPLQRGFSIAKCDTAILHFGMTHFGAVSYALKRLAKASS